MRRHNKHGSRPTWFKFRSDYLAKQKQLSCYYCGKSLLYKGSQDQIATLDHIVPVSKGGEECDEENIVVSCNKCNLDKGNKK